MIPEVNSACFPTRFPRILGGITGSSNLNAVDIDSSNNIAIGGGSSVNELFSDTTYLPEAFVAYISNDNFLWTTAFSSTAVVDFDYVKLLKFSNDFSKLVLAFD